MNNYDLLNFLNDLEFEFLLGIFTLLLDIGIMVRVFANGPGFNPRSSHTKDSKMVLDASLLNTQYYQVRIKGKVEKSWPCIQSQVKSYQRLKNGT